MEKTERYNYVFDQYDGDSFIYDSKEGERIEDLSECADILNKKEKEIERWFYHKKVDAQINRELIDEFEELKSRLSNCIEPKFKPHNDLFVIVGYKDEPKTVEQYYIDEIVVRGNGTLVEYRDIEKNAIIGQNNTLLATREEAERYLEELKNG